MKRYIILTTIFLVSFVSAQSSCPLQTTYSNTYATLVGEITDTGGDSNISAWFEWGKSSVLENTTPIQSLYVSNVPYRFCYTIDNLQPCTTYYYRAVIRNSAGTNYGSIYSFTTRCLGNVSTSISVLSQTKENQPPIPIIAVSPSNITPGTKVTFDASRSYDPDGYIVSYRWEINGEVVSNSKIFSRVLSTKTYRVKLTVTDNSGASNSKEMLISVGRNVYKTRTITKTITKTVKVPETKVKLVSSDFGSLLLEDVYKLKRCKEQTISFTLVNNTSAKRNFTLNISGVVKHWFEPETRTFVLGPNETRIINWNVIPECCINYGKYEGKILLTTSGYSKVYPLNLEIEPESASTQISEKSTSTNPFVSALANIGNAFKSIFPFILILLTLVLAYFTYRFYKFLKEKEVI